MKYPNAYIFISAFLLILSKVPKRETKSGKCEKRVMQRGQFGDQPYFIIERVLLLFKARVAQK